ncbi:MAG: hypothetical protein KF764_29510 [Labilithrix sp.]|nr:hypothetical protein [Labilithrix sp.]
MVLPSDGTPDLVTPSSQYDGPLAPTDSGDANVVALGAMTSGPRTNEKDVRGAKGAGRTKDIAWTIGWLILFSLVGNFLFGAGARLGSVYRWVAADEPWWHYLCGVYAALALCLGAVWMRRHHRLQYGAIESGLAIATILSAIKSSHDPAWVTSAVLAGVYLFVRGQDNIETGREQRERRRKQN